MALTAPSWLAIRLLDANVLPDSVIRGGIRRIVAARLRDDTPSAGRDADASWRRYVASRSTGPIAGEATPVDLQSRDLPADFYRLVLGRHMKFSAACWDAGVTSLDEAEARMLALSAERADLSDGQRVLDLGCGWGSFSLWIAHRFPRSEIVGVTRSRIEKSWIDRAIARDRLANLRIVVADMNAFEAPGTFDRVVSVEMFEHMRNWRALLLNVARWLRDDGRLFVQIFVRRAGAPLGETGEASDWLARDFFSIGMMPQDDLLSAFPDLFTVEQHWRMSGTHYEQTANAWLANLDRHRAEIEDILGGVSGVRSARRTRLRWRVFFMACAELWGHRGGQEWLVSHYRLEKPAAPAPGA